MACLTSSSMLPPGQESCQGRSGKEPGGQGALCAAARLAEFTEGGGEHFCVHRSSSVTKPSTSFEGRVGCPVRNLVSALLSTKKPRFGFWPRFWKPGGQESPQTLQWRRMSLHSKLAFPSGGELGQLQAAASAVRTEPRRLKDPRPRIPPNVPSASSGYVGATLQATSWNS